MQSDRDAVDALLLASIADGLNTLAVAMAPYLGQTPLWTETSVCAADHQDGSPLAAIRAGKVTLAVQPVQQLAHARTHIIAMSKAITAADAMPAQLTLMRSVLAAAGTVFHLLPYNVDDRERHRRLMNAYLYWTGEALNYVQDSNGQSLIADRRNHIVTTAKAANYKTTTPAKKATAKAWPEWHVGDRFPAEMTRLAALFGAEANEVPSDVADSVFRLMSAATHAQPHTVYAIAQRTGPTDTTGLNFNAPVAMPYSRVIGWMHLTGIMVNRAMVRAGDYYGWDLSPWEHTTHPVITRWAELTNVAAKNATT